MRDSIIAEYHQMLAADESLTSEFLAGLKESMRTRRLSYGGREIGVALRPHLLSRHQYNLLCRSSELVAAACNKVASALLAEPWRMKTVGLTDREMQLALVDPRYSTHAVTIRLDGFIYGDEIKFVECNAENPSSLSDQAGLNEVLLTVGAMRTTSERYNLSNFFPAENLLSALLDTYQEWGGSGPPNIAIVDWEGLPTANEFVLLQNSFHDRGVRTLICSPEQLDYEHGKLRCGDFPIDLIYKRVIFNELLAKCDDSHPLIQAYLKGDVCMVNSFRCKIIHKKAVFELLTDEANRAWFTPAEREVIDRTVPWTRRVGQRKTRHRGREVDLVEYIRRNKADFVLKPNDDYGGRGITIGSSATTSQWDAALSDALAGDHVVQEKIDLQMEVFPIFSETGWALQPMYVDTNPFLFGGRVEGAMVRLSGSPVVNVTSGGGETGFFIIEEEAKS